MVTRVRSYGNLWVLWLSLVALAINSTIAMKNIIFARDYTDKLTSLVICVLITGVVILFFWMAHERDFKWFRRVGKLIWHKMRAAFRVELPDNVEDHDPPYETLRR